MNWMTWFMVVLLVAVAILIVRRLPQMDKRLFVAGLMAKLLSGLALGLVYFYYYDGRGDTVQYWEEARIIASRMGSPSEAWIVLWSDLPDPSLMEQGVQGVPRSFFFSKIAAIASLLTNGNYWLMSMIFSFMSFLAAWKLFGQLQSWRTSAAVALFFFPSVVFWSSGLIKESLGLAAIYVIVFCFLKFYHAQRVTWLEGILFFISIWVGWNLKYYWLGILTPVLLATLGVIWLKRFRASLENHELLLAGGMLILLLILATGSHPNFYPNRIALVVAENNEAFVQLSSPSGFIHFNDLKPTMLSLLMHAPWAFASCLFRPWLGEAHQLLSLIAAIENAAVLLLFISAFRSLKKFFHSADRLLIGAILMYSMLLSIFLALSTPNFGTLSRYKVGFLPFLVLLLLEANPRIGKAIKRLIPH